MVLGDVETTLAGVEAGVDARAAGERSSAGSAALSCQFHRLRSLPVAMATGLCGLHFAAAQCTRFKQAFLAKGGFRVGLPEGTLVLRR